MELGLVMTLAGFFTSCSLLQRNQAGMTADNPIVLDTMELSFSPPKEPVPTRSSDPLITDVLHTALDLHFDIPAEAVMGKATLTVQPYANAIDTVVLDARGFTFEFVGEQLGDSLVARDYSYDGSQIRIQLDSSLAPDRQTKLVMKYVARPAELEKGNGRAIRSSQGLYFINPEGDSNEVHPQVWSQGETEYNSGWFPCVDQPNEKHTQEIMLTVDTSFTTLSNGRFVYAIDNGDGKRTDVWKQEKPHSTYLTMIAIGDFAVVKDTWRDLDVWYYVDPEFEPHAMKIFGNTPEMLEFYSNLLGVDYPWEKFHQVIVHDFVSGAMENTSAVIHGQFVQQTPRQMIDGTHEDVIAHELFHHWFGDLVTSESWTQITMNEGFASYGEYLWWQHKYGEEEARMHLASDLSAYLGDSERGVNLNLIRRNYGAPDDVFDRHSYQKGSRALHMLRKEIGDDLFFAGLKYYLEENAFGSVEDVHLRLAMEKVTGRDLYWFFDQWYHREGHPIVSVSYDVDSTTGALGVLLEQEDRFGTYQFHVDFIAGDGNKQARKRLWVDQAIKDFNLDLGFTPTWYAIDPEGDMLWQYSEEKDASAWMTQLKTAPHFMTRMSAFEASQVLDEEYGAAYTQLLLDIVQNESEFWALKKSATDQLPFVHAIDSQRAVNMLIEAFRKDNESSLRVAQLHAIDSLSRGDENITDVFIAAMKDSSMRVVRTALGILTDRDPCSAIGLSQNLAEEDGDEMFLWISRMHAMCGNESSLSFFQQNGGALTGIDQFMFNNDFARFARNTSSEAVYDALVEHLSTVDMEEMTWWARMSAMEGLNSALQFYDQRIKALEAVEAPGQDELGQLAELRNKRSALAVQIEKGKELLDNEEH